MIRCINGKFEWRGSYLTPLSNVPKKEQLQVSNPPYKPTPRDNFGSGHHYFPTVKKSGGGHLQGKYLSKHSFAKDSADFRSHFRSLKLTLILMLTKPLTLTLNDPSQSQCNSDNFPGVEKRMRVPSPYVWDLRRSRAAGAIGSGGRHGLGAAVRKKHLQLCGKKMAKKSPGVKWCA